MREFFQRIILSLCYIAKTAWAWTVSIYAIGGIISLFVSFEGLFPDSFVFWKKLLLAAIILIGIWLACFIVKAVLVGCQRIKKVIDGQNGKSVYVMYGDLFDPKIVKNSKRYICFAVNRCFDTVVDDKLVGATTIHGIAFKKLYASGKYTENSLNQAIHDSIKGNPKFEELSETDKPAGNHKRYEVGTYSNISIDKDLNYLLLGLSYFDANLNAQTPKQDYVKALQKMIEIFDMEAQGYPVLIPIIGTGRSRTDLMEREALEYLIEALKINKRKITSDIYSVVFESAKNRVSIADL